MLKTNVLIILACVICTTCCAVTCFAQGSSALSAAPTAPVVTRDPQAVSAIARTITAMGASPPSDSVATGTVHLVAGSRVEDGSIRILTRGMNQSKEEITVKSGVQTFIFDDGFASDNLGGGKRVKSFELGASSQSPSFPLPVLGQLFANPDVSIAFVGTETIDGVATYHLRLTNTFASIADLQSISKFSTRDVWIEQASGLPRKISYDRRFASGASPAIRVDVALSDYRNVNGYLYPFHITKSLNGTSWATITIQSVTFNNGLTTAEFSIN